MKKVSKEPSPSNENEAVQVAPAEQKVTIIRNVKIEEVPIGKITPDPDQPRSSFDQGEMEEMARSIVTTKGVINPIEIDENFMIITGEKRWRATKLAGLPTITAKIVGNISAEQRFMRQVIENVQNHEMSFVDQAKAFDKILRQRQETLSSEDYLRGEQSAGNLPARIGEKFGKTKDQGVGWLAQMIGKSPSYVEERRSYITERSEEFKKSAESGKVYVKFHRAIKTTPEKYKEAVEKKVLKNEFKTVDEAMTLVRALKREGENTPAAKQLMDIDYSRFDGLPEVTDAVSKISPPPSEILKQSVEPRQKITKISRDLRDWVMTNPEEGIKGEAARVRSEMETIRDSVRMWFGDITFLANEGNDNQPNRNG